MPIYVYHCDACGQDFEKLVRANDTPQCPQCGNPTPHKQVSAPTAPGRSKAIIASARRQAAREGHMSNFSAAERSKLLRD
ncbi:MAG TPA: zinc ribbon domain-containing protein [Burkholderiaceae bacterium]